MAPEEYGVATWSSVAWRERAIAWMDERLREAGIARTGEVEQTRVRSWSTVLRAPTAAGPVWMKAAAPATAFEAPLYELLARVAPEHVLIPLATDAGRGWMLLPDGGPTIALDELPGALAAYAHLQRELLGHEAELLGAGVADMRPAAMPGRFREALEAAGPRGAGLAAMEPRVLEWCAELAASPVPASLDHNDLHQFNVLAGGRRFYDWGDSVLAHPFAVALVPLGMLGGDAAARDAYLDAFSGFGTHPELVRTLEVACRVAKIARTLVWDRALRSAREQGEPVDPRFEDAQLETLRSIRDDSHLLGA
jgi:hypothetical protein